MNSADALDGAALRRQWALRPDITYLHHGAYGPAPRAVIEARAAWFARLQADPMHFFTRELEGLLAAARARLARFLGADADDLVFVDNATTGMNIVAHNVPLQPGDEVLINDHEYGAVLRTWERKCARTGARLLVQPLPCPLASQDETVAAILKGVGPRTRLLIFSHVTSSTAVILPAAALCREARRRGVLTCIDGPHAVGMLPVDLRQLDCDYYVASCHKWLSAPFGSGFMYVNPRRQAGIEPLVVSWGSPQPYGGPASWRDEFGWVGTRDPSAYLSVPAAIDFFEAIGWERFRAHTHELARLARRLITELTGLEPLVPDSRDWYGSMISLPLPPGEPLPLQQALWERYRIEAPIIAWAGRRLVRPSCHVYNGADDVTRLAEALGQLLAQEPEARPLTSSQAATLG